eukprot:TRINITY_DN1105_c0_g1_i6.p1 TRINITY_DN1105_c0_g1~~TRINITY_DN1105_c0_g1_i6.p1  ORF type:complete len:303 (-),score=29.57 TRINITY_DN1105_c0_g1_i6:916-1824(-)
MRNAQGQRQGREERARAEARAKESEDRVKESEARANEERARAEARAKESEDRVKESEARANEERARAEARVNEERARALRVKAEADAAERKARVRLNTGPEPNHKMMRTSTLAEVGSAVLRQFGDKRFDWCRFFKEHNPQPKPLQWPSDNEWAFFSSHKGPLPETEIQQRVTQLLEKQPAALAQFCDTHSSTSCCGVRQPVLVLVEHGKPISPLTTLAVLDLKKQSDNDRYNSNANIGQIYTYACKLLAQLPGYRQVWGNFFIFITTTTIIISLTLPLSSIASYGRCHRHAADHAHGRFAYC